MIINEACDKARQLSFKRLKINFHGQYSHREYVVEIKGNTFHYWPKTTTLVLRYRIFSFQTTSDFQ